MVSGVPECLRLIYCTAACLSDVSAGAIVAMIVAQAKQKRGM